jgi:hypothetical protein
MRAKAPTTPPAMPPIAAGGSPEDGAVSVEAAEVVVDVGSPVPVAGLVIGPVTVASAVEIEDRTDDRDSEFGASVTSEVES